MKRIYLVVLGLLFTIFVYKSWFLNSIVSSGDLGIFNFHELGLYAWGYDLSGLGSQIFTFSWLTPLKEIVYFLFVVFLKLDNLLVEKVVFFYSFLLISFVSPIFLYKSLFKDKFIFLFSALIFLFNTYVLMVVGGGQIFVALSYATAPLVLLLFIKLIDKNSIKFSLISSLVFSLQMMLDLRIAYITIFAVFIYWLIFIVSNKSIKYLLPSFLFVFIIPGIISVLTNFFWVFPTVLSGGNLTEQLGSAYSSLNAVKFFSFASFENSISLLHPNWPENIFGKVYFMRPEFLLLPMLAFASLFFINKLKSSKEKTYIQFFALLGIIGAFLAKGSNDPFGGIYLWMFNHIPGFVMFRDSTKFYLLIVISYSILIPLTVSQIHEFIKLKTENLKPKMLGNFLPRLFTVLVIGYLLFLIRPALLGQLGGTFKSTQIPTEYTKLEEFLSAQNNFSRTLWVPTQQRFAFYTNTHPAISAQDIFSIYDNGKLIQKIKLSEKLLQEASVKYVIVPYDSQGEIFLNDRKYDNKVYLKTIDEVKQIPYLKQVSGFGKITVFEVPSPKDHFYINNQQSTTSNQKITYRYVSPVEYKVNVQNVAKGDKLIFSENYDAKWVASTISGIKYQVSSTKYEGKFNSFVLPQEGNYTLNIYYYPQKYVEIGSVVSLVTLIAVILFLILSSKRSKNK